MDMIAAHGSATPEVIIGLGVVSFVAGLIVLCITVTNK
jgi:hypothetical protein